MDRRPLALLAALAFAGSVAADKPAHQNRLANESSPYLRQHAHNPVDWYPWGPEAFEKAKKEDKLVFLSIGYSSCHWCHVMERESFDNADVAKILNDSFVCIKVDREERPDIDEIYMNALYVFGQSGGWPLSMFLTPDAKPIVGGTYWPPDDRVIDGETAKGFKSVLKIIKDVKDKQPKQMNEQADKIAELTRERLAESRGKAIVELNSKLLADAAEEIGDGFDPLYGGYGRKTRQFRGPKFPTPTTLEFILEESKRAKSPELHKQVILTLEKMANGGIFDHLGGGFHRYTIERTWTVPHFEKMLYDNAQLVELYSEAYESGPNPLYARAVRDTLAFVKRELTAPEGVFYSALDADSEGEEGKFYVWTPKQMEQVLTDKDELALAREAYGVTAGLNFEKTASILTRNADSAAVAAKFKLSPEQFEAKLEAIRAKLFAERAKRPRPFLDTKVLTAWNGQMIAGLAEAGRVFKEPAYIADASKAAEFLLANMRNKDGRLMRSWISRDGKGTARLNGYLDDYAFLAHGLLALHRATHDKRWLDEAKALTDTAVKWHLDEKQGGYFYTSHDHEKLFARSKDQFDGAQPSGNSVIARDLVRLGKFTGVAKYSGLARGSFEAFAGTLKAGPNALTTMLTALGEYLDVKAEAKPTPDDLTKPGGAKPKKSADVVKITATAAKPDAAGKQVVTIALAIEDGWYTYANPVGNKEMEGSETVVKVAGKGNTKLLSVDYPKGLSKKEKVLDMDVEYMIYEGKVTIKASVQRAAKDAEPLEVTVKFGACNKRGVCLLPTSAKVSVP